jgi:hypothetical protein
MLANWKKMLSHLSILAVALSVNGMGGVAELGIEHLSWSLISEYR